MPAVSAIVAAGGFGVRSASSQPKQFRLLGDRTVLSWSVDVLARAGCEPIFIAAPPAHVDEVETAFGGRASVIPGGGTRQASVANCLAHVTTDVVLIHDGARPFITEELVAAAIEGMGDLDGVVVAMPMDETIKSVEEGIVRSTVDRSGLWRVQTPQVFRTEVLRRAHAAAEREGVTDAVDDAALIERTGGSVGVVEGARTNLKITLPEDFAMAEALRGHFE